MADAREAERITEGYHVVAGVVTGSTIREVVGAARCLRAVAPDAVIAVVDPYYIDASELLARCGADFGGDRWMAVLPRLSEWLRRRRRTRKARRRGLATGPAL